jgi:hypothetical protein
MNPNTSNQGTETMKHTITLITALLLAPLAALAQQAAPNTVRDRLWVFAPPADGPRLYTRVPDTAAARA